MSQELINHSPDLKKLQEEGYEMSIKNTHLFIRNIPYVNSKKEIKKGTLISTLILSGNKTTIPKNGNSHVAYFIGDYPCDKNGASIEGIRNGNECEVAEITVNYVFSNKPKEGYQDYYQKMVRYIEILSVQAQAIDPSLTAKTFNNVIPTNDSSVFHYLDTNSSKAKISEISNKLISQKIAIIGVGGTGSYVLDLVSKTQVSEIHIFDEDDFLNHNAFRTPSAASIEELKSEPKKVEYLYNIYSKMHKGVKLHNYNIELSNLSELLGMDFVFICIDSGKIKKDLFLFLNQNSIPFIDTGIGVEKTEESLLGIIRTNLSTSIKNNHLFKRISTSNEVNDEYSTNIQIAELNALNASLAVIKWKKYFKFYLDNEHEYTSLYTISLNSIINEDH